MPGTERLLNFPTKNSPTGSDILYTGDAANSYNEVQTTIDEAVNGSAIPLKVANNLSDVNSASTSRSNLGLGTANSPQFTGLNLSGLTASEVVTTDGSKNLISTATTGSGNVVLATSPTLVTPALGTPASGVLTNCTGLPISTGVSGLGTGVATGLGNAATGTGSPVLGTSPAITTPKITTGINDTNGNQMIAFSATASAANNIQLTNQASGSSPIIAAVGSSDTNVLLTLQGKGNSGLALKGRASGSASAAGYIGEVISSVIAQGSAVSMTTNTAKNITSISCTAGYWLIFANVSLTASGQLLTNAAAWTSTTSATQPDASLIAGMNDPTGVTSFFITAPTLTYNFSSTTTVYLGGLGLFASGTLVGSGGIYALRIG